jgi:hypothetical protein
VCQRFGALSARPINTGISQNVLRVGDLDPGGFEPACDRGESLVGVSAESKLRLLALNDVDLDLPMLSYARR